MSNIYGGAFWVGSSFIFDKIYPNFNTLQNSIKNENGVQSDDGVFALRYVLVKYCDTAFSHDERIAIEQNLENKPTTEDANKYYENYITDNNRSYDRKVFRKFYKNNKPFYEEIANLSTTLSAENLDAIKNEVMGLNISNSSGGYSLIQTTDKTNENLASGAYSSAFGLKNTSSNNCSVAFGGGNRSTGAYALATGYQTQAKGNYSFTSGYGTNATGQASCAFGRYTTARSIYSFAQGYNTIASLPYSAAFGKYNDNTVSNWLFAVGNGVSSADKNNAFVVYSDGGAEISFNRETDNAIISRACINELIDKKIASLIGVYNDTAVPEGATEDIVILYI